MAKGLAVVSGSSDVVFKALETGVIALGSTVTDAEVTLTGSLVINKHADGGEPLTITGLASSVTGSVADDILVIDSSGVVKRVEKLDASDVQLDDGQTLEQFSGSVDGRLDTLESSVGTGVLVVSGSTEIENVDLADGSIQFLGTNLETDVTVTTSSAGNVVVTVGLPSDVTISNNLTVNGSGSVTGDLTVTGDLLVQGSVTTIESQNLVVKDPIILVGSGSDAASADLGIIFGTEGGNNRGFSVEGGEFFLGTTTATPEESTTAINVNTDGVLNLGALSASVGVSGSAIQVGSGGLLVAGTTTLNGNALLNANVTLGNASTDVITLNGYITGSGSPIVVSSSLTIGDAGNVNNEVTTFVSQVRMPIYTISGDALEGTFPAIPSAYISSPTAQGGHMFYLTASTNVGLGDDSVFPEANKWYMNERGVWHESFFFVG